MTLNHMVLLGEPDRDTSELYQRTLRTAFGVVAAFDEDTVLDMLHTRPLAALVLEPVIFAAYAWERLAIISAVCAERDIPLVVCSTLDERQRAVGLSVAAYLVKPTLPSELLATLRQVIAPGRSEVWVRGNMPHWPN